MTALTLSDTKFEAPEGFTVFEVGQHFVCPLYDGDLSGLDDDDCALLEAFIAQYGDDVRDSCDYDEFGRCEITDLRGRTARVLLKDKETE